MKATSGTPCADFGAGGRLPTIMPWWELCSPGPLANERLIEWLRRACVWTDAAIVVTQEGGEPFYEQARTAVPRMQVWPGARVVQFVGADGPLEAPGPWGRIAQFARQVTRPALDRTFVLEVEYPLYGYWEGTRALDLPALTAALRQLPRELDYVWYPGALCDANPALEAFVRDATPRALALWRAVQAGLERVRFAAGGPAHDPGWDGRTWTRLNDLLLTAEDRRFMDSIYAGTVPAGLWPLDRLGTALARVRTEHAFLWCADALWAEPATHARLAATVYEAVRAMEG